MAGIQSKWEGEIVLLYTHRWHSRTDRRPRKKHQGPPEFALSLLFLRHQCALEPAGLSWLLADRFWLKTGWEMLPLCEKQQVISVVSRSLPRASLGSSAIQDRQGGLAQVLTLQGASRQSMSRTCSVALKSLEYAVLFTRALRPTYNPARGVCGPGPLTSHPWTSFLLIYRMLTHFHLLSLPIAAQLLYVLISQAHIHACNHVSL